MTRELWGGDYRKVLPVSIQDFDLAAVLPAVFYLFRFGHRRGRGKFAETFSDGNSRVTIEQIASRLTEDDRFVGFTGAAKEAILGDLLLSFCFENRNRALGRREPVQRVFPTHYFASWVDLPAQSAHLRYVPESIVAILANQEGPAVKPTPEGKKTWFPVVRGFEKNVLLEPFLAGVLRTGELGSRTADCFDEECSLAIDELLIVRIAQLLGEAPDKLRGGEGEEIPNQMPLAEAASRGFSEDMRRFVRAYASVIPRQVFVELLESCMAVGLSTIFRSLARMLFVWAETGEVLDRKAQRPIPLLVDCSNGVDHTLRAAAEDSLQEFLRQVAQLPVIFMALRILDYEVRSDPRLRRIEAPTRPYASEWVALLGAVLHGRHEHAGGIHDVLSRKAEQLAQALEEEYPDAARLLRAEEAEPNVVLRMAESLVLLLGRVNTWANLLKYADSVFVTDRPNGLVSKRKALRTSPDTGKKSWVELRSAQFTDPVLDYLVHLHLLPSGNKAGTRVLSFRDFLKVLRDRYGLYVDEAPEGVAVSGELLHANRAAIERRLRDLGLLLSVSDAEAMKALRPRFQPTGNELD
jgi:hypothetical protein